MEENTAYYELYRTRSQLRPMEDKKRQAILQKIKECPNLTCKVDEFVKENLLLDAMTLLELEKRNNKNDLSIDALYWKIASQARLSWMYRAVER